MFAMAWTELSWPNSGSVNFQSHLKSWARYRSLSDKKYFYNFCFLYQTQRMLAKLIGEKKNYAVHFWGFRSDKESPMQCRDTMLYYNVRHLTFKVPTDGRMFLFKNISSFKF